MNLVRYVENTAAMAKMSGPEKKLGQHIFLLSAY